MKPKFERKVNQWVTNEYTNFELDISISYELIAPTPNEALQVLEFDIYYKTIPGDTESKIAAAKHSIEVKENSHLGKKKLSKQFNTFFT